MDTVKSTAVYLLITLTFAFNARLYADEIAVFAYSESDYDPWYVDCYYYRPVEVFQVRVPVQSQCRPFMSN
ncbi:MAG: hypothetical protein WB816_02680 [Methylocystis sp.]